MTAGGKRGASREARFGLGLASVLVLAALVVFAIANLSLTSPRESLCDQARALATGRLLPQALETIVSAEGKDETCDPGESLAIKRRLSKARKNFAAAAAFAAVAAPAPGKQRPARGDKRSGLQSARTAKAAKSKLSNTRRAVDRYRKGLALYPFEAKARKALGEQLAALPTPRRPRTAAARCRLGRKLTRAGLLDEAATTVPEGLRLAHASCAKAMVKLNAQRSRAAGLTLAAERTLARDGNGEPVRRRYAAALIADAGETAAREGLEGSIDDDNVLDEVTDWLTGIPATLKAALPWIAVIVVALVLLALGAWIAVRQLSAHSVALRQAFRRLGEEPGLSALAKAAIPEVNIKSFEGDDSNVKGADFSALLEAGLVDQAVREQFAFDWLSEGRDPNQSEPGIADLLTEVPETKLLGSILKELAKLFRRRAITVSGRLIPNADDGAGVLLKLEGNGRNVGSSITLWERAFDPFPGGDDVARRLRLVPAATVWVRHQVAAAQALPGKPREVDWRAEALFTSGVAWQTMEDWCRAEALYAEARELDASLLPATHNLAVIDVRQRRYKLACRRLELMREQLDEDEQAKKDWPTLATASLYTLVLSLAYTALSADDDPDVDAEEAARALTDALGYARTLVKELSAERPGGAEPGSEAARELRETLGPSIIVLVSLFAREHEHARGPALEAALAWERPVPEIKRSQVAATADSAEPWRLINGYLLRQAVISRRAYYNLACYLTNLTHYADPRQQPECFRLALKMLEEGLVGGYLHKWVEEDPSLQPLKDHPEYGKQFADVVKTHAVAAHSSSDAAASPASEQRQDGDAANDGEAGLKATFQLNLGRRGGERLR